MAAGFTGTPPRAQGSWTEQSIRASPPRMTRGCAASASVPTALAAVMFRSALSLFIKDKGGEKAKKERHLKNALKHMKEDGDLHKSLWNWADHLNQLGNEGAHPEDYDDVTADEATGLSKFVRNLIHLEYEMPARLRRDQGLLEEG